MLQNIYRVLQSNSPQNAQGSCDVTVAQFPPKCFKAALELNIL